MDIVDLQRSEVESDGRTYKYVLVVMDVVSRFLFLRPLTSKSSTEVASHVLCLVSDIGPPKIVQTDKGTEFKRVVQIKNSSHSQSTLLSTISRKGKLLVMFSNI